MKNNVPEIRFQGFDGEWDEELLSQIVSMKARIGWQGLTKNEFLESGDYYLITGTDFENGSVNFKNCHYISKKRYIQDINIQINNGDVLITKDGTIGKVAYVQNMDKPTTLNAGVFVIRGKNEGISNLYLYHYLAAPFLLNYAYQQATGGTIKHLNQNVLIKFPVPLPKIKEQTKIGNYFKNLDQLISLKQRKLNKLKNLKKSMLQKMFPQEGATVPEIRFQGFSGEWERKTLGNVANFTKGHGYSKSDIADKGTPIILYGSLYTNYQTIIDKVNTYVVPREGSIFSNGGEVIVPASGETAEDIARASAVIGAGILLGGDLNIVYPNDIINPIFLALSISNGKANKELAKRAQGKSVVHLRNNDLKEITVNYPSIKEQTKIGNYFKNLDHLISLQQKEIDKLKQIKSSCLSKMFV